MKQFFIISLIAGTLFACNSNPKNPKSPIGDEALAEQNSKILTDSTKWTSVLWTDSVQDFGKVVDGEKVQISFHFKNTGNQPLIITSATASCGCTVPSKPEEPIAPGEEGIIKAEFNSEGRVGVANKYITVTCNTKEQIYTLKFNGEVLPKK